MAEALAADGYGWFTPADLQTVIEAIHSLPDWESVVLVGGQSLTAWALYYEILIPPYEGPYLTANADFLASRKNAELLAENISDSLLKLPSFDEHTPNTAVIIFTGSQGTALHVDLLNNVLGVDKVVSVPLQIGANKPIKILHSLLVLESRCANLCTLPHKRDLNGRVQAHVGLQVARAYFADCMKDPDRHREALKSSRRISALAQRPAGIFVHEEYGLDVTSAVDPSAMPGQFERSWSYDLDKIAKRRRSVRNRALKSSQA